MLLACAEIRFQCMGRWMDTNENIFMAVADLGQEIQRFRFRCLVNIQKTISVCSLFIDMILILMLRIISFVTCVVDKD